MSGARPLVTLYAFMTWAGENLPFFWGGGEVRGGNRPQCVLKNNHVSCLVDIRFKTLSGHQLPDCFSGFSQSLQTNWGGISQCDPRTLPSAFFADV